MKKWSAGLCVLCMVLVLAGCASGRSGKLLGTNQTVKFVSLEQQDSAQNLDLGSGALAAAGSDFYLLKLEGKVPDHSTFNLVSADAFVVTSAMKQVEGEDYFRVYFSVAKGFKPLYIAMESYSKEASRVEFQYYDLAAEKWLGEKQYTGYPVQPEEFWGEWG